MLNKDSRLIFVGEEQTDPFSEERALKEKVQLVYISPESAICNHRYRIMFLSLKYKESLVALAIAHCVKTWGEDFRTTFALSGELRSFIPTGVSVIATATSETLSVVTQTLSLVNPTLVALPTYRENIAYKVHKNRCGVIHNLPM